eukprot:gene9571-6726_t
MIGGHRGWHLRHLYDDRYRSGAMLGRLLGGSLRRGGPRGRPYRDQSSDALSSATRHTSPYREQPMLPSDETAFDTYLPVRLVVVILAGLSVLGGVGAHVGLILLEPPYKVPRMRCLREQLEEAHPTWYK